MRPSLALPPELYWPGTKPIQAANWRPLLNSAPLPTIATIAVAVVWPTPMSCINCCAAVQSLVMALMWASYCLTRSSRW